jgi:cohesin loading factor subunit SCC2
VGYAPSIPNGRPLSSQPSQPPARQDQFSRPFTIEEALPYTPFTSIVPINSGMVSCPLTLVFLSGLANGFGIDIIPTPNLGSASPATALTDTVATSDFETLNAELRSGQPASKRLEHALASLHNLLDPKRLPE